MKYKFLLAIMLLFSGCSTPPKEEVKKETPSVSFVAVGDNLYHQCMLDEAETSSGYDFSNYYAQFKKIVALSNLIQRIYHNDIRNMLP